MFLTFTDHVPETKQELKILADSTANGPKGQDLDPFSQKSWSESRQLWTAQAPESIQQREFEFANKRKIREKSTNKQLVVLARSDPADQNNSQVARLTSANPLDSMICCAPSAPSSLVPSNSTDSAKQSYPLPIVAANQLLAPRSSDKKGARGYLKYEAHRNLFCSEYGRMITANGTHVSTNRSKKKCCEDAGFCLKLTTEQLQTRVGAICSVMHQRVKNLGGIRMNICLVYS